MNELKFLCVTSKCYAKWQILCQVQRRREYSPSEYFRSILNNNDNSNRCEEINKHLLSICKGKKCHRLKLKSKFHVFFPFSPLNHFIIWSLMRHFLPFMSREYRSALEQFESVLYGNLNALKFFIRNIVMCISDMTDM